MKVDPYGYLEEITRPQQEIGCCCYLEYVYTLRDLPAVMLTAKGHAELHRARQAVAEVVGEVPTKCGEREFERPNYVKQMERQPLGSTGSAERKTAQSGLKSRLMSWLQRRES